MICRMVPAVADAGEKKLREKLLACGGLKVLQLLPSLCNCLLSFSVIWEGDLLTGMI